MRIQDFARRRRKLMQSMGRDTLAIVPSARIHRRTGDIECLYRQDSDFYYLTGFAEPDAIAVLAPLRSQGEYLMFCRERDAARERWDGRRVGTAGVRRSYGVDKAFAITAFDDELPQLLSGCKRIFYTMGLDPQLDARIVGLVTALRAQAKSGVHAPREFADLDLHVHAMRVRKSAMEMVTMRASAAMAVAAHRRAMKAAVPGVKEYQIAAEILHEFHRHGAVASYPPIVGSGQNACILHYHSNTSPVKEGDLLLVDAGCEYEYYASDVTRTFPVSGRFTPEQRALYEVVLEAQYAAIDACRAGNLWNAPHDAAVKAITRGLVKLGLLSGKLPNLIKSGAYQKYFMHRTGHWLGMDVHDVGAYKIGNCWRAHEPGMVRTIEPGIYIAPDAKDAPKAFRGIGIRIEDDIAITPADPEVLSGDLVKDADAIEAYLQER